jgi:tripartite-type tricarboxylate transporter receptor subunit TctC
MIRMHRRALLASLAAPIAAQAQTPWRPERPVRLVVPFAPGGALDITARLLAREMEGPLGQPIVVENRSGAGGNVGAEAVARAAPDGHTFLISSPGPLAVNQFLFPQMPYDAESAFAPVVLVAINPVVILAAPARPERSLADFIATARARATNYATSGSGGAGHMAMEVLKARLGLGNLEHVPFRGAGPSLQALAGNQVEFAIESITSAAASIAGGTARPLAVTTARRWPGLPAVPTVQEAGVADFDLASWTSFVFPAGTPPAAVARLNAVANDALRLPAVRARLLELGADPQGGSAEELDRFIRAERAKWREAVRVSGARAD